MKLLDASGNEIVVGARVRRERVLGDGSAIETVHVIGWRPYRGWTVQTDVMFTLPTQPAGERDTYRCPDLQVVGKEEAM